MTPAQIRKQVTQQVAAVKRDGATRRALILAEMNSEGYANLIAAAVYEQVKQWAWAAENTCYQMGQEGADVGMHRENVRDAGISEDDLRYWPEVLRSIEFSAA